MQKILLIVVLAGFGAFSSWVMLQHGYLGIWQAGFVSSASLQVLIDLVIVCALASIWIIADARKQQRNPWPYVVVTLFGGSLGPLSYLLIAHWRRRAVA